MQINKRCIFEQVSEIRSSLEDFLETCMALREQRNEQSVAEVTVSFRVWALRDLKLPSLPLATLLETQPPS